MQPFEFKYHPVDNAGNERGLFASRGRLDDEALLLDKFVIPSGSILQVVHRYQRLMIVYATEGGKSASISVAPKSNTDRTLKEKIDLLCSRRWADNHRAQLEKEGNGQAFRAERCLECTAIVDLTGFAETPFFHCCYCQGILPTDEVAEPIPAKYRLCDNCHFYSHPIQYTAFWVVLNIYGWQTYYSCHVCMRRHCWWMLLVNLLPPFIGLPFAVWQTIRAYGAGLVDSYLPELNGANAYARKGEDGSSRAAL